MCVCVFCSEGVLHREELLKVCVWKWRCCRSLSQCYQDQSRAGTLQKAHADVARCGNGLLPSIHITKMESISLIHIPPSPPPPPGLFGLWLVYYKLIHVMLSHHWRQPVDVTLLNPHEWMKCFLNPCLHITATWAGCLGLYCSKCWANRLHVIDWMMDYLMALLDEYVPCGFSHSPAFYQPFSLAELVGILHFPQLSGWC